MEEPTFFRFCPAWSSDQGVGSQGFSFAAWVCLIDCCGVLCIRTIQMDASNIEFQCHLSPMLKQTLSLLHQFQLPDSLVAALQEAANPSSTQSATLMVL